jgi:hypothetical protein
VDDCPDHRRPVTVVDSAGRFRRFRRQSGVWRPTSPSRDPGSEASGQRPAVRYSQDPGRGYALRGPCRPRDGVQAWIRPPRLLSPRSQVPGGTPGILLDTGLLALAASLLRRRYSPGVSPLHPEMEIITIVLRRGKRRVPTSSAARRDEAPGGKHQPPG